MAEQIVYNVTKKCPLCGGNIIDEATYIDVYTPGPDGITIDIECCETCGTKFKSAVLNTLNTIKGV